MNAWEARALLEGAGAKLSDAVVQEVFERTEGWPAGLYLAALALQASGAERGVGPSFSGDDRLMADYLRSELLAHLSAAEVTFLTRSAVLDRMCGPLCDAVLGAQRSANVLEELERSNLLLVPLDRRREWYRYHHLFRDLLRAELSRREPALVPELHRRAAAWFEANGLPEMAIEHAQAGGDADRVARLVAALAQPTFASGRVDTVLRWIEWFDEHDLVESHPAVAAYGATIYADLGRAHDAERWAEFASRGRADDVLPDGSTMRGLLAFLRMRIGAESAEDLRRDAEIGLAELSPASRLRPAMLIALGWASVLEGDFDDCGSDPRARDRRGVAHRRDARRGARTRGAGARRDRARRLGGRRGTECPRARHRAGRRARGLSAEWSGVRRSPRGSHFGMAIWKRRAATSRRSCASGPGSRTSRRTSRR